MKEIPEEQVIKRLRVENPWWDSPHSVGDRFTKLKKREYFSLFFKRLLAKEPERALVLMGPRRVGKTVLIHHAIQELLLANQPPSSICYVSVDHPIYNGLALEEILDIYGKATRQNWKTDGCTVFFDEIQYLRQWERHLKRLVDDCPGLKLVASGSAAAALKLKSNESGAGRFTDFLLPPLTFHEYVCLIRPNSGDFPKTSDDGFCKVDDIHEFNRLFIDYLNFGGYPEVALSKTIQLDPAQYIKSDIIDKVLLRDLPSLYGILDIQELNHLFTALAFNTAQEVSLEGLAKKSGVAKNTIKRYIEYLEAAFLLKIVHRVDRGARRFRRANFFKVYLTNPSLRSALFSPIDAEDDAMGGLAETAAFAQWFHSSTQLNYARWPEGEVDIVSVGNWATEVKWSDRYPERLEELKEVVGFARENQIQEIVVTTKTIYKECDVNGVAVTFIPVSAYCYTIGQNIVRAKNLTGIMRPRNSQA